MAPGLRAGSHEARLEADRLRAAARREDESQADCEPRGDPPGEGPTVAGAHPQTALSL